jgi:hypothetical protein
MFLEILQTLIKVLIVFSILIIAFGLAFYILLSRVSLQYQQHFLRNKDAGIQAMEEEPYFFSFSVEM